MASFSPSPCYEWGAAKGLMSSATPCEKGLQGALVPDGREDDKDHIAVVYDKGDTPPLITIEEVSGTVHTVLANGVAVAVVADAAGRAPSAADVLLVERSVLSS
ncbi:hypothetical protein [Sulfitobacter sp. S190]|uniref:hypothetical protein n=1 Tax=Sulfitobacter sp. S190 TaxID=2867022 RepID=UPI0021A2987D|nr:hypothetical protein [Sulfitobacter sp. S190]UWR23756.1 hypothetical protein K3756_07285 [Sulfitobacter sp. S190]